VILLENSNE
jgi:hypothetical protein